jgi:ParB/RepB/Spo0J family partition protein
VAAIGLINPISVMEHKEPDPENPAKNLFEGYRIIDGLHRYYACKRAGHEEIPCIVLPPQDDIDLAKKQITANLQRVQTKPHEYARKLRELMAVRPTATYHEFAQELCVSVDFLKKRLNLLKLNDDIAVLVDQGEINLSNAFRLAGLPKEEQNLFKDEARTADSSEFAGRVEARIKELRQERMAQKPKEQVYEPVARCRSIAEVKAQLEAPRDIASLLSANGVTDPMQAAKVALNWAISLDEPTVAVKREEFDVAQAKRKEEQARRTADNVAKKKAALEKLKAEVEAEEAAAKAG